MAVHPEFIPPALISVEVSIWLRTSKLSFVLQLWHPRSLINTSDWWCNTALFLNLLVANAWTVQYYCRFFRSRRSLQNRFLQMSTFKAVAAKRKVKFYCPSRRRAISTELWAINLDWCCDNKLHFNVIHLLTNLKTRRPLCDQSIGSTLSIVIIAYLGHDAIDANAALNFLLQCPGVGVRLSTTWKSSNIRLSFSAN